MAAEEAEAVCSGLAAYSHYSHVLSERGVASLKPSIDRWRAAIVAVIVLFSLARPLRAVFGVVGVVALLLSGGQRD